MREIDLLRIKNANRVIVTATIPYNPKKRKDNVILADVKRECELDLLRDLIQVEKNEGNGKWMSPIDAHINFMQDKSLLLSLGLVLDCWLRHDKWECDFHLCDCSSFHEWLVRNKV